MKKGFLALMLLGALVHVSASYEDGSGWVMEVAYGKANKPYNSKLGDGVFTAESIDITPEDFSRAMSNDGDMYIMGGIEFPVNKNMYAGIGVRTHARDGVRWEVDIQAKLGYDFHNDWRVFGGGSFGRGNLDIAFDTITVDGEVIDFPSNMKYSTASFNLGVEYTITDNWSLSTIYEIKEVAVNMESLNDQIDWSGTSDPLASLLLAQKLSSYESTTHSLYLNLKYKF